MNPLVSVIIPVYKVEKYLDRCVESVVNQTYKNLEIILVDDGSPDNCPAMCDTWAEKDARIKVIHKKNGGLSDARNVALDIVKGEYVTFVDSDDMLALNIVEILVEVILKEQSDMVLTKHYTPFSKDIPQPYTQLTDIQTMLPEKALEIMFCEIMRWEAWGSLYRRTLFESVRYPVGKLYEDISVTPKVVLDCHLISLIEAKGYFYYNNPESIMRAGNRNAIIKYDLYLAVSQMVELFHTIREKEPRINAVGGILEELLSRVHLASGNKDVNRKFIRDSKILACKNLNAILFATKITAKRKIFMLLVLCGCSRVLFK